MEKRRVSDLTIDQGLSFLRMGISKKWPLSLFLPLAILAVTLTASFSYAFELDKDMLAKREEVYQRLLKGELTNDEFMEAAREAERKGWSTDGKSRMDYVEELLNPTDPKLRFPLTEDGQPVIKRSGTAPTGDGARGIMSDEDLMFKTADELALTGAERQQYEAMLDEYYQRAVTKLRKDARRVQSDALSTRTSDDVLFWKPKPFKSKAIGHVETEILTKAQEHEYAIYAAAGAGDKAKTIGQAEEAILDNLNKGAKGFATDPSEWIGDDKMMHKLWDELRITAKDTHRSMKTVGLDQLDPGTYDRYVKLASGKSLAFKPGSSLDKQFTAVRLEQKKMRKVMKTAMAKSRKETTDQVAELFERMKAINTVDEMDILMRQAGEVSDRMYRIGETFKLMEHKYPALIKTMDFPTDPPYLAQLNRMSARLRRLTREPTVLLMNLLVKYLPEGGDDIKRSLRVKDFPEGGGDLQQSLNAILDDKLDDLPEAAKSLQKELAGVAGLKMIALEELDAKAFLKKLSKEYSDLTFLSKDVLVQRFLKKMNTATSNDLARIVGRKASADLVEVREMVTSKVRANVAKRFTTQKFLLWEVDQKTQRILLGEGGIKMVAFDGIIGSAMALYQTSAIMEQNLPPEEENRQIMNAWVTSLPLVGDFSQSIIYGSEAIYEGDSGKAVKSGIFLTLGVAYVVPGLQLPAIIGSLGMVGYEISASAWAVSEDKNLVFTWVQSGKWNPKTGKLIGLYDARNELRPVQSVEDAYLKLIDEGDIGYHSSLLDKIPIHQDAPPVIVTMRNSVLDYAERAFLAQDKNVNSIKDAVRSIYPDFDLAAALREPLNTGRTLFAAHIIAKDGLPKKDPVLALFVKLKKEYYTTAVHYALNTLKKEAEAEYQAEHGVGEVAVIFKDLAKLDQRLGLNLTDHVTEIHESFLSWAFQILKSPWNKHSIPRRHVDLARKYRDGYKEIEKAIERIQAMTKKAGLKSPKHFNLTGYLEIDQPRINDLETVAYPSALADALADAKKAAKELEVPGYTFSISDSCSKEVYQKLAQLRINIVHSEDWKLLMDQWSGKKSAVEQTRDTKLLAAQNAVSGGEGVFYVPLQTWRALSDAYEEAYAWVNVTWEGSQVHTEARANLDARIRKLESEYEAATAEGIIILQECLGKLTVHVLPAVDPDETAEPIRKATVYLTDKVGKELNLAETEDGDYLREKLAPGDYTLFVSAKGYETSEGKEKAEIPISLKKPVPGEPPIRIEKTIMLSQIKGALPVQVIDARSKAPVHGALIRLTPGKPPYEEFQEVDEEGRFQFKDLKPRTDYRVEAKADYYEGPAVREGIVVDTEDPTKSTPTPIELAITPILSEVRVTVKNTVGDMLDKVAVGLGKKTDVTKASGLVVFEDVSPSVEDPYELTAELGGYAPVKKPLDIKPDTQGQVFSEDIELQPGGQINVHVLDKETGAAIPEPEIRVSGYKYDNQKLGDHDGKAIFKNLALEAHYIQVLKEGYLAPEKDREVLISANNLEQNITIKLYGGIKVKVSIKDETTGELIIGSVSMDGIEHFASTGTYEFERVTTNKEHTFKTWADCYSEEIRKMTFQPSAGMQYLEFALKPSLTLRVEAREAPGSAFIEGASRISVSGPQYGRETGGPTGLFSGLTAGGYTATVSADGYSNGVASITIDPKEGKCGYNLQVALQRLLAGLSVSVSLTGERAEGEPPPEVSISMSGAGRSYSSIGSSAGFSGLPKGSYTVSAVAKGYGSAAKTVMINPTTAGQSYSAALTLKAKAIIKEEPSVTAEELKKLIEEGRFDEANALLNKQEDGGERLFEGLPPELKEKLLAEEGIDEPGETGDPGDMEEGADVTVAEIVKMVAEGKTKEAGELLGKQKDGGEILFAALPKEIQKTLLTDADPDEPGETTQGPGITYEDGKGGYVAVDSGGGEYRSEERINKLEREQRDIEKKIANLEQQKNDPTVGLSPEARTELERLKNHFVANKKETAKEQRKTSVEEKIKTLVAEDKITEVTGLLEKQKDGGAKIFAGLPKEIQITLLRDDEPDEPDEPGDGAGTTAGEKKKPGAGGGEETDEPGGASVVEVDEQKSEKTSTLSKPTKQILGNQNDLLSKIKELFRFQISCPHTTTYKNGRTIFDGGGGISMGWSKATKILRTGNNQITIQSPGYNLSYGSFERAIVLDFNLSRDTITKIDYLYKSISNATDHTAVDGVTKWLITSNYKATAKNVPGGITSQGGRATYKSSGASACGSITKYEVIYENKNNSFTHTGCNCSGDDVDAAVEVILFLK